MAICFWVCSTTAIVVLLCATSGAAPAEDPFAHERPPSVEGLQKWESVHSRSVCRAHVDYSEEWRVLRVWCADGVEGQVFEARGREYVCSTLRLTIHVPDLGDIDVPGGCVARFTGVVTSAAKRSEDK